MVLIQVCGGGGGVLTSFGGVRAILKFPTYGAYLPSLNKYLEFSRTP